MEDFAAVFEENEDSCFQRKQVILHFDIDCFYAQVEMIKDPSLTNKPLGIKQKNIVVTCNYVAREKGVVKCSYITEAMKVCPELVLVNGEDLADYRKSSQQIFDLIYGFSSHKCPVEKLGMDENFIDVSDLVEERLSGEEFQPELKGCRFGEAGQNCTRSGQDICPCHRRLIIGSQIAQEMRQKLYRDLNITSSCGIAHNKVLAKIGGGKNKPNKQTVIFHETQMELMLSLSKLRSIPGLGSTTCDLLARKGIQSITDLQSTKACQIPDIPDAQRLIDLAFGKDNSSVKLSGKPLSIGLEDRFKCISTKEECLEKAKWLLGRLAKLVLEDGRKPQTLKVFIRDFEKDKHDPKRKFAKYSRQCKVNPSSFKDEDSIVEHALQMVQLISKMVDFGKFFHLTLMGVAVTDFVNVEKKGGIHVFLAANQKSEPKVAHHESGNPKEQNLSSKECKTTPGIEAFLSASKRKSDFKEDSNPAKKYKNEDWDQEVFDSLPEDVQNELLSQRPSSSSTTGSKPSDDDIPKDWDPEVFAGLPHELKQELLKAKKQESPPAKKKTSSILSYFSKK